MTPEIQNALEEHRVACGKLRQVIQDAYPIGTVVKSQSGLRMRVTGYGVTRPWALTGYDEDRGFAMDMAVTDVAC